MFVGPATRKISRCQPQHPRGTETIPGRQSTLQKLRKTHFFTKTPLYLVIQPGAVCQAHLQGGGAHNPVRARPQHAHHRDQVVPENNDVADWRSRFPDGPYVSIYFLTPQETSGLIEPLHELSSDEAIIGASPLRGGGLGIKLLAKDGLSLFKAPCSPNAVRTQYVSSLKRGRQG